MADKITKSSTKDVIYAALQEAQAKIKELEANKLDPKKEVEVKKAAATVEKAETIVNGGVKDIISSISEQVTKALAGVAENIESGIDEFNEVKAAIDIKKAELKELFGVEDALLNLATVVNSQNDMRAKFQAEFADEKAQAKEELDDIETKVAYLESEFRARIKTEEADIKAKRVKEEDEYKYNTARAHKIDADKWEDEKSALRKAFEADLDEKRADIKAQTEDLNAKENDLTAREAKMEELEAKVASIPTLVSEAADKAAKDAEASAKKSYGFETMMLKKENEGKVALLEAKIGTLEGNATRDAATIKDLQDKLNAAYAEIKDMAAKSIEGASNSRAYAALEGVVKDMQRSGSSK